MRFWIVLTITMLTYGLGGIYGCKPKTDSRPLGLVELTEDSTWVEVIESPPVHDTIYIGSGKCDSLRLVTDSLKSELFMANYRLETIRSYYKICLANPSQKQFLMGWIKRALE